MTTTEVLRRIEITLEDDGSIRSTKADYVDVDTDAAGNYIAGRFKGTKLLDAADLSAAMPAQSANIATINALQLAAETDQQAILDLNDRVTDLTDQISAMQNKN